MKQQIKIDLLWIGRIMLLLILFFFTPIDLFSQEKQWPETILPVEKVDSTLFKKYTADIQRLQELAQKLEKDKYEFLGKYFESLQNIQQQFLVINQYLEEQKKILEEAKPKKEK